MRCAGNHTLLKLSSAQRENPRLRRSYMEAVPKWDDTW